LLLSEHSAIDTEIIDFMDEYCVEDPIVLGEPVASGDTTTTSVYEESEPLIADNTALKKDELVVMNKQSNSSTSTVQKRKRQKKSYSVNMQVNASFVRGFLSGVSPAHQHHSSSNLVGGININTPTSSYEVVRSKILNELHYFMSSIVEDITRNPMPLIISTSSPYDPEESLALMKASFKERLFSSLKTESMYRSLQVDHHMKEKVNSIDSVVTATYFTNKVSQLYSIVLVRPNTGHIACNDSGCYPTR
jgi:hypothetical protein